MALNERVHVLRESVVKLTQMLAGAGVQVTQRGISAFVKPDHTGKPVLVNLPYLPDNATDELIDAIQGFLDHEVAHILFTDFKVAHVASHHASGSFWNSLEDTRIERNMASRFRGSAENLARTGQFFLDKYVTPKLTLALSKGDMATAQGVLMVPMIRAMAGQPAFAHYMKDKMSHVQAVYDKIKDLTARVETLSSTQDALDVSIEMVARLRDGKSAPTPPPAAPPPPKAAKAKPSKGKPKPKADPGDTDPSAGEPGDGEEAAATGEKEDDEEKPAAATPAAAGEGDDEGDEDDDEEKGAGEGEGDDEEDPATTAGDPDEAADEDENSRDDDIETAENDPDDEYGTLDEAGDAGDATSSGSATDTSKSSGVSWKEIDKETANSYDDSVSGAIATGAAQAAADAEYLVYTRDMDVVEPLRVGTGYKPEMLARLQESTDHMVAPLQKDLERAIAARSLSHWTPGHRSGKLHAANLSRLALNDSRVFRRKEECTSKDVAVELVIDASGSMSGGKIHTATAAAYALAAVLERIGIKCEVICFTTGAGVADYGVLEKEAAKIGRQYSRYEALYMPILKGFDERLTTEVKSRFGWLPNCNVLRNNVDGECIEIAGRRLMGRREKGKIMMVLSDGAPHAGGATRTLGPHLKKVVGDLTKRGIKVIGIGIESDEVRQFYPKHLMLNNVADLPTVVMKELRQLIIG